MVWDSGRVGPAEQERLSTLIWGRLDSANLHASGLNMSLPEACRLSDALAGQLRVRLGLELSGAETTARLRSLRAQLERIREQINLEPAGTRHQQAAQRQSGLARRLRELTEKAERGGDVGGLLEPLEIEATTFERDLIVDGARRREAGAKVTQARRLRTELDRRETDLRLLVDRALATVDPAPHYAVPDVDAIGPVPNTLAALEDYLIRLNRIDRALSMVQQAYAAALDRHTELVHRLEAYRAKAEATGLASQPDVARAYALAVEALQRRPTPDGHRRPVGDAVPDLSANRLPDVGGFLNMTACSQPGCPGSIVDGYCDVCGSPGPGDRRRPSRRPAHSAVPSLGRLDSACTQPGCSGTIVDGYCDVCGSPGEVGATRPPPPRPLPSPPARAPGRRRPPVPTHPCPPSPAGRAGSGPPRSGRSASAGGQPSPNG